jgi:hypothetical protein
LIIGNDTSQPFVERYEQLKTITTRLDSRLFKYITQTEVLSIDQTISMCESIIEAGGEGLMLKNANSRYKFGRSTEKERSAFKMKDEFNKYTAIIADVLEGTVVDPLADTSINELGYSVTSKLKEDRLPSGKAKNLLCIIDMGGYSVTQKVSLSGFNDQDKIRMLHNKRSWILKKIEVEGMKPTIEKGKVRGAFYKKK